jgi:phosphoribosylformylglycinamidine cyclo-ligase
MTETITYSDAGVDIDKGNKLVGVIKEIARQTHRQGVMGEIGGFGALFSPNVGGMEKPVLVSSTDGVGTKLKIAFMMNRHNTVGIDLVAMSVNDVAVQGARPLFFLDYISMGKLNEEVITDIIRGIGDGCKQANCALIGGETAEMPGFYGENEYDLAGFCVGLVDNPKIIDGSETRVGDKVIGIASSGLHSNGYSLVRKICFEHLGLKIDTHIPELGKTLGEELLTPTRIYSETIQKLIRDIPIHGLAHITGGGLMENIVRVIPNSCGISINRGSWNILPVFKFLQQAGNIAEQEMFRVFNCGIGMAVVVPETAVNDTLGYLSAMSENAWVIGEITRRKSGAAQVMFN